MGVDQESRLTAGDGEDKKGVYTISASHFNGSKSAVATMVPAEQTKDAEKANSPHRTVAGKDVTHPTS